MTGRTTALGSRGMIADAVSSWQFFWYFKARVRPEQAPTAIYLAGGAGESSMWGAASDGGPCYVVSTLRGETGSNDVTHPLISIDCISLDQPVGTGFSYDALFKSTFDALFTTPVAINDTGNVRFDAYSGKVPEANSTFFYGVLPSQVATRTANTSVLAARTLWHFSQAWMTSFPEWATCNKAITIWGESTR
ncbi:hypothetical protein LTR53_001605 [Teratosphaeriaceae sp. CCFEE 6253]|nr:hypothetical protein LTR53_001605 [Teratosphaeriaceae sp. CCFEE 6253]